MTRLLNADGEPTQTNGRFKITWEKVLTLAIATLLAYGAMNARVAVLEIRVDTLQSDISEIKGDVKALLRGVR